ncbi:interferon-induced 35 kDa protein-like isoform X1 [Pithys albifrons albifrons]|uniref:interferon-induced 35 kDa protein-like isoform X1 n=1 Tax=Pithys albifrons albifrons TaxID=3385563 RepID=UPI003A5CF55F
MGFRAGRGRGSESESGSRHGAPGSGDRVGNAPRGSGRAAASAAGMDSEEDSFVRLPCSDASQNDGQESLEQLRQEIDRFKERHSVLEQECEELQVAKEAAEQRTRELRQEGELLRKTLEQQLFLNRDEERALQGDFFVAQEKNNKLRQEKRVLKSKLEESERALHSDPMMMLSALPEKKMMFKGLVANKEDVNKLTLTPWIQYPLPGGSALITFEKAEVAQRIIEMKEHVVKLSCGDKLEEPDQCRMRVQAAPVELLLPSALEIRLTQSSRSILVSDLPSLGIPEETLLDKLELFFSKTKNGGSEVESREFWGDSGQMVLTFTRDGVAEPLIEKGHIQVLIERGKYKVKISPCMIGSIINVQLQPSRCSKTVLLSGIPDLLDEESMRDTLEIHFQKASRGGGEVDALAYVPAGQTGLAVFVEDTG